MTNLIIHHSVADVFGQASKRIHVIGAVQEPCDLASLFQWGEVSENFIQFPNKSCASDRLMTLERARLPFEGLPPRFLLDLTLGNWRAQRLCQPFNPRHQRFYRFVACYRLLGRTLAPWEGWYERYTVHRNGPG